MSEGEKHITSLKTYLAILGLLLTFTFLSIAITYIDLGPLAVPGALLFAILKTTLIVVFFMHLKFEKRIYGIFTGIVFILFFAVVVITFLDYIYL